MFLTDRMFDTATLDNESKNNGCTVSPAPKDGVLMFDSRSGRYIPPDGSQTQQRDFEEKYGELFGRGGRGGRRDKRPIEAIRPVMRHADAQRA